MEELPQGEPGDEVVCPVDGEPLYARVLEVDHRKPATWTGNGRVLMGESHRVETVAISLKCSQGHSYNCPSIDDWA